MAIEPNRPFFGNPDWRFARTLKESTNPRRFITDTCEANERMHYEVTMKTWMCELVRIRLGEIRFQVLTEIL
jgi:hypothetical protein